MLNGLADNEVDQYLEKNLKLILLFEIDVIEAASPYMSNTDTKIEGNQNLWKNSTTPEKP